MASLSPSYSRSAQSHSVRMHRSAPHGDGGVASSPLPKSEPSRTPTSGNNQVSDHSKQGTFRPHSRPHRPKNDHQLRRDGEISNFDQVPSYAEDIPGVKHASPHLAADSGYKSSSRRDQSAESSLAPVLLQTKERSRQRFTRPLDSFEDDYDSEIELAKALSLSLEISGSSSSSFPEMIASNPEPQNDQSCRPRRPHVRNTRRQTGAAHAETSLLRLCPICLEDMAGRVVVGAPCGHTLCRTCRAKLVQSSDKRPKCHMCRTPYEYEAS